MCVDVGALWENVQSLCADFKRSVQNKKSTLRCVAAEWDCWSWEAVSEKREGRESSRGLISKYSWLRLRGKLSKNLKRTKVEVSGRLRKRFLRQRKIWHMKSLCFIETKICACSVLRCWAVAHYERDCEDAKVGLQGQISLSNHPCQFTVDVFMRLCQDQSAWPS